MNTSNSIDALRITPSGGPLGAEIGGVNLSAPLLAETAQHIRRALLEHCVIYFRGQTISDNDQVRFTNYFGLAVEHVRKQPDRAVNEVFTISNVEKDGQPIGALGNREIPFHSDLSYLSRPGTFSFLYAVEVPRTGGGTQWINCYAAYDALADELKQRLAGMRAVHRHPIESQNPPRPVDHPVVRTHPETGRRSLYVGPHLTRSLVGLGEAESRRLLDDLYAHLQQQQFVWTHQWQVGDLVMWDNRPTLHRRQPFPATQRRIMKRTQIYGDEVPCE